MKSVYEINMEEEAQKRKDELAAFIWKKMMERRNCIFRMYLEISTLTQQEIADITGVTKGTVARWSNCTVEMSMAKQMYVVDLCMKEEERSGVNYEEE